MQISKVHGVGGCSGVIAVMLLGLCASCMPFAGDEAATSTFEDQAVNDLQAVQGVLFTTHGPNGETYDWVIESSTGIVYQVVDDPVELPDSPIPPLPPIPFESGPLRYAILPANPKNDLAMKELKDAHNDY